MNKYLEKLAEKKRSEAKPHQLRVLKKLESNSVIAAHSMGSGKTLTALLAAERAQKDHPDEFVTIVVPASLVSNMKDQIKEHGIQIDPKRLEITTYDKAVNNIEELKNRTHSLVVVDEAHKLRNSETKRANQLRDVLKNSRRNLLLTGTPSYNKPEDIAALVNQVAGQRVMPDTAKDFEKMYIGKRYVHPGALEKAMGIQPGEVSYLKAPNDLKEVLNKYVDHHDTLTTNPADFPTVSHELFKVEMDKDQERIYNFLEGNIPGPIRWKIRMGLPLSKKESADLNSFSTGVRQASNNIRPYVNEPDDTLLSPKQKAMADNIHKRILSDANYRGITYSNYLESGLKPLHSELKRRRINSEIFSGSLNAKQKADLVEKYNSGQLKHLLVSSSGAEGLNLKGTKLVQIMEPHFNKSKIDQVVARGVRYRSHEHLPEPERHVEVEHYHSVKKHGLLDTLVGQKTKTIDEYLTHMSHDKERLKNEIMDLTKSASVNRYLSRMRIS